MTIPKHQNPSDDRTAYAPYNFVPLPHKVVNVLSQEEIVQAEQGGALEELLDERLPPHNRYIEGRHNGYFEVTLTTETPLYIRAPLTLHEFSQRQSEDQPSNFRRQAKNKPDFFYSNPQTQQPVIPGSSLRGMLRSLVEIVGYGKMQWVTDTHKIFYRAVAAANDDPLGIPYENVMGKLDPAYRAGKKVRAGYLTQRGDGSWWIQPAKSYQNKPFVLVKDTDGTVNKVNGLIRFNEPSYHVQYHDVVYVEGTDKNNNHYIQSVRSPSSGEARQGVLVCSGNMLETNGSQSQSPRGRYALVLEVAPDAEIPIAPEAIRDYCDSLTAFQQEQPLFDKGLGFLKEGRPIFFIQPEEDQPVYYFGHSPNFRIPARFIASNEKKQVLTPYNLIPTELCRPLDIDWAEAMFGYVKGDEVSYPQGHRLRAYASRISVTDATLNPQDQQDLFEELITPNILSTPKPTSFQHYLIQDTDEEKKLKHYGSDGTTIRGHKLYWHHGRTAASHLNQEGVSENSTQHTQFSPVKPCISFTFRIYFENLSKEELGLLAWVLMLPGRDGVQHRHKLGMAKPFGMGAVKLKPQLFLIERPMRYGTLFNDTGWALGESDKSEHLKKFCLGFEQFLMQEIGEKYQHLYSVGRIKELLALLEWHEDSSPKLHMGLKQFEQRRILPTPTRENFILPDDKVEGKVIDIQRGDVIFEITDAPDERMIGIIPVDKLESRQYRVDAAVSAIIEQIEERPDDDEILIYCRPKSRGLT